MNETINNTVTLEELGSIFEQKNKPILAALSELKAEKARLAEPEKARAGELAEVKGLEGIMKYEIWGIPVAQAAIGGAVAVLATELVDGFMAKQSDNMKGAVKLVLAGAAARWGKKIFGETGSKAIALLMAFDGLRMIIPIDKYADQLASKITKTTTTQGLAGIGRKDSFNPGSSVLAQANQVVRTYKGTGL